MACSFIDYGQLVKIQFTHKGDKKCQKVERFISEQMASRMEALERTHPGWNYASTSLKEAGDLSHSHTGM